MVTNNHIAESSSPTPFFGQGCQRSSVLIPKQNQRIKAIPVIDKRISGIDNVTGTIPKKSNPHIIMKIAIGINAIPNIFFIFTNLI